MEISVKTKNMGWMLLLVFASIWNTQVLAGEGPALERVMGTITKAGPNAIEIAVLGQQLSLNITERTQILLNHPATVDQITSGTFVGITATAGTGDQPLKATEVHMFPETLRGLGQGSRSWFSDSLSMTNGNIEETSGTAATSSQSESGITLRVSFNGGEKSIFIGRQVPVTRIEVGSVRDLVTGKSVSCLVRQANGGYVAQLISVDGNF